jgi:hypothetical protein
VHLVVYYYAFFTASTLVEMSLAFESSLICCMRLSWSVPRREALYVSAGVRKHGAYQPEAVIAAGTQHACHGERQGW